MEYLVYGMALLGFLDFIVVILIFLCVNNIESLINEFRELKKEEITGDYFSVKQVKNME